MLKDQDVLNWRFTFYSFVFLLLSFLFKISWFLVARNWAKSEGLWFSLVNAENNLELTVLLNFGINYFFIELNFYFCMFSSGTDFRATEDAGVIAFHRRRGTTTKEAKICMGTWYGTCFSCSKAEFWWCLEVDVQIAGNLCKIWSCKVSISNWIGC